MNSLPRSTPITPARATGTTQARASRRRPHEAPTQAGSRHLLRVVDVVVVVMALWVGVGMGVGREGMRVLAGLVVRDDEGHFECVREARGSAGRRKGGRPRQGPGQQRHPRAVLVPWEMCLRVGGRRGVCVCGVKLASVVPGPATDGVALADRVQARAGRRAQSAHADGPPRPWPAGAACFSARRVPAWPGEGQGPCTTHKAKGTQQHSFE